MCNPYFNQPKTIDEIALYIDLLYNTSIDNVIFLNGNIQNISYENIKIIDDKLVETENPLAIDVC